MLDMRALFRRHAVRVAAVALVAGVSGLMWQQGAPAAESGALAGRFAFTEFRLPELQDRAQRSVRTVHPDLQRISAWISSVGAGVALSDLDGDGLPNDVCYVDTRTDTVVVTPAPGTAGRYRPFALEPGSLPYDAATMAPMGCLPGDLNEDGRTDLLVYFWGRTPVLYVRRADAGQTGPAAYRPAEVVPAGGRWFTNAATLADLDGDGHLDLAVGNYFPDGARVLDANATERMRMQQSMSRAFNGGGPRFLLWKGATAGSVTFAEAPMLLGDEAAHGWTLAIGAADLDGDLLPEVYAANDFGPDRLLHNRSKPGELRFALLEGRMDFATPPSGVIGRDSFKGMGVDFADMNGDGWLDILVSNIANPYALLESHFVWIHTGEVERMQRGEAPFVNRSEAYGLARSGWGWDIKAGDFDNDGVLEVVQATGFVKGERNRWPELQELATGNDTLLATPRNWPRIQPGDDLSGDNLDPFFVRGAGGRYHDMARAVGLGEPRVSRGIAMADIDGDGDLDFASATQWGPSYLHRNDCRACGSFLGLRLRLSTTGRPAVGAEVRVTLSDSRVLVAQVDGGNGHSGKRSPDLFFGLGQVGAGQALDVQIRWREPGSGQVREEKLSLVPGWHTVQLGRPGGKE